MIIPLKHDEDFPDPIHNPKTYQTNAFLSGSSEFDEEDLSLYKDLMRRLVEQEPQLHPAKLTHENNLSEDFAQLDEIGQRKQYRTWAGKIVRLIKPLLADESFMVKLCTDMSCTFMDVIYCLFAYYGALIYKQPQFSRWLTATIGNYSDKAKKIMGIPRLN